MFLIYPYWNVNNQLMDEEPPNLDPFLIYPYWNVNADELQTIEVELPVSNLSILECKFIIIAYKSSKNRMFLIYPYWNVNI